MLVEAKCNHIPDDILRNWQVNIVNTVFEVAIVKSMKKKKMLTTV